MVIVYAMTRNLYPYFRPGLISLLDHNDVDRVYVLAEDDRLPYDLPECCRVINVSSVRQRFERYSPNLHSLFTWICMARVLYTEIMPDEDRVIQLDIDTIICDSLQPIWDTDLTDKWVAACPEHLSRWRPFGPVYYNVGVSVHNLAQMRADDITPQLVGIFNTSHLPCMDQDALNFFGAQSGKFAEIPVRYNECFCCGQTDDPAVVHFAGWPDWYENRSMPRVEYLDQYRN